MSIDVRRTRDHVLSYLWHRYFSREALLFHLVIAVVAFLIAFFIVRPGLGVGRDRADAEGGRPAGDPAMQSDTFEDHPGDE